MDLQKRTKMSNRLEHEQDEDDESEVPSSGRRLVLPENYFRAELIKLFHS
jgi:hypothetical protein